MPTVTVPLGLTKPTVGGDKDVWGQYWNDNADKLNAIHVDNGTGTSVGMHVGTGKTLNVEGIINFADPADVTKRVNLLSTNVTTATTRTLYFPDENGTLATKTDISVRVPTGTVFSGYYGGTAPPSFVMADGRTIGDATSTATNRANADTVNLFTLLWNITANAQCAVSGGRGASAAADYAAHKTLALPNHSGRAMFGRDDLSGTSAGILSPSGIASTTRGAVGGQATETAGVSVSGTLNGGASVSGTLSGSAHGYQGGTISDGAGNSGQSNIETDVTLAVSVSGTLNGSANVTGSLGGATSTVTNAPPTIVVDVIIAL